MIKFHLVCFLKTFSWFEPNIYYPMATVSAYSAFDTFWTLLILFLILFTFLKVFKILSRNTFDDAKNILKMLLAFGFFRFESTFCIKIVFLILFKVSKVFLTSFLKALFKPSKAFSKTVKVLLKSTFNTYCRRRVSYKIWFLIVF